MSMYKMADKLGCKMPPDLKTFGRSDRAVNIFLSVVLGGEGFVLYSGKMTDAPCPENKTLQPASSLTFGSSRAVSFFTTGYEFTIYLRE